MTFDVAGEAYGRFMGRFSEPLAPLFAELVGVAPPRRALDVGCGPGALTHELVERLGVDAVSAADPSEPFIGAVRLRFPGVDARRAHAEDLPYPDATFDVCMAQLVIPFMTDPAAGVTEMARVTRPAGAVAACVWDHAGGLGPLSPFWRAVRSLDPAADDESTMAGTAEGDLAELFDRVGLVAVEPAALTVHREFEGFAEWWEPFTLGVGPAGAYVAGLGPDRRRELQRRCAELFPDGPFAVDAVAWAAVGRVRG